MLDFLKFGKKMPTWLAVEAKDSSRSCQKSVDRTMKAIKKLMLSDDQAKSFFKFELNYQKEKSLSVRCIFTYQMSAMRR